MMTLYLSSRITGTRDYKSRFAIAEGEMKRRGYKIINPASLDLSEDPGLWQNVMKEALKAMLSADGVCLFGDWENSRGALLEKEIAERIGMPVRKMNEWL